MAHHSNPTTAGAPAASSSPTRPATTPQDTNLLVRAGSRTSIFAHIPDDGTHPNISDPNGQDTDGGKKTNKQEHEQDPELPRDDENEVSYLQWQIGTKKASTETAGIGSIPGIGSSEGMVMGHDGEEEDIPREHQHGAPSLSWVVKNSTSCTERRS